MFEVNGVPVAVPPPSGYTVNFEHPQRQCVLESYIIAGIGMGVASFFMVQRFYVHYHLRNNLSFDDLLLLIAWAGSITIQALIIHAFKERLMGIHAWEIPYDSFKQFSIIGGYTTSVIYTIPTTLSKVVILLFYRKLESPHIWYRWAVNIVIFVVAASGFSILFSSLFPCHPVAKSWDIDLAEAPGYCIDRKSMYEATAALGVITDFLIILIPIPLVISLRLSIKKKLGLLLIFAVGSATVVTSIVRLALLISLLSDADQTWGGGPVCMWICVEANLLIICASQFTIRHFFAAVLPRRFASNSIPSIKRSMTPSSGNHELRTFGISGSSKRYYSRFDETDICTDTIINVQGLPPVEAPGADVENGSSVAGGIIQTKETVVFYEST